MGTTILVTVRIPTLALRPWHMGYYERQTQEKAFGMSLLYQDSKPETILHVWVICKYYCL
jgi:hypothetical protein